MGPDIMEFAGKKAYLRRNSLEDIPEEEVPRPARLERRLSVESFSDDELSRSLCDDMDIHERNLDSPQYSPRAERRASVSSSGSDSPPVRRPSIGPPDARPVDFIDSPREEAKMPAGTQEKKRYRQRVDTNVICVKLSTLQNRSVMATGDAVFCKSCRAALNSKSVLQPCESEPSKQVWVCEFCEVSNVLALDPEEFPQAPTLDYMIMSQPEAVANDISVVFCIDISGSMVVSQAVSGKLELRGLRNVETELQGFGDYDRAEQFMLGDRNTTYVSRLQCVQAAIDAQLTDAAQGFPSWKIGLVAFNSDVVLVGDAMADPYILTGDRLNDFQACVEVGTSWGSKLAHEITETKEKLSTKVWELQEGGATALGPALLAAIGLASHGKSGSKVIICTDGIANVGVGSINNPRSSEELTHAKEFYAKAGAIAKEKGISVSVITIEGEECSIERLSEVAEFTGGEVMRVNPLQITNEFANILSKPVIATHVTAVVKMHRGLHFRDEDSDLLDPSTLCKDLGNVNEDTEFTFEYSVRSLDELRVLGVDPTAKEQLPFQTQIHYTMPDGMKCMRVITAFQGATEDKEEAEQEINFKVLGVNAAQQSAKAVKTGNYRKAQVVMRGWRNMMNSRAQTEEDRESVETYLQGIRHFNREVQSAQVEERVTTTQVQGVAVEQLDDAERNNVRWANRGDKLSYMNYNVKKANSKNCALM